MNTILDWLIKHPDIVLSLDVSNFYERSIRIEMRKRHSTYRSVMMVDCFELEHALYDIADVLDGMLERHMDYYITRPKIICAEDTNANHEI